MIFSTILLILIIIKVKFQNNSCNHNNNSKSIFIYPSTNKIMHYLTFICNIFLISKIRYSNLFYSLHSYN